MGEGKRKPGPGRPRQYASNAERQRAYRARLKERGFIEVRRIMRRAPAEGERLRSDVLDLSFDVAAALRDRGG